MDTIEHYREQVKRILTEYADVKSSIGQIHSEAIFDDAKGHYEVIHIGWMGKRRVHGMVIHIDIIGDKLWIQYDGTSPGVAQELVEAGIPREAIVLGFRPPDLRKYSGFAVA